MSRFLGEIMTERDSFIHRLGHKFLRCIMSSSYVMVRTYAHYVDKKQEMNPDTEFINIEIDCGRYTQYMNSFMLCHIKNGKIYLPENLQEKVEEWNKRLEEKNNV